MRRVVSDCSAVGWTSFPAALGSLRQVAYPLHASVSPLEGEKYLGVAMPANNPWAILDGKITVCSRPAYSPEGDLVTHTDTYTQRYTQTHKQTHTHTHKK